MTLKTKSSLARQNLIKRNIPLFLLAIPGVLYLLMFTYAPMGGVIVAFKDYNYIDGIFKSPWVGLKYFKYFFASNDAFVVIRNTLIYAIVFHIVETMASILVAIMLYNITKKLILKIYQTVIIIPYFISWVLIAYIGFALFSNRFGLLNSMLSSMGLETIDWYTEPKYWPFILIIFRLWKDVGMACIIYYATLLGIDESLFEAAKMDGAGSFQRFVHVIVPAVVPVVCIKSILAIAHIMSGDFGLFYQLPMNSGSLYPVTDIMNTYVYRGLQAGNMSQTAAIGLFQSLVGLVLVLITNTIIRKVSPENSMF